MARKRRIPGINGAQIASRILGDTTSARLRHRVREAAWAAELIGLPPHVARFQSRARRLAWRDQDYLSLMSATRPASLRTLLGVARGASHVVELGTATGWTAISLALASDRRRVTSYDVVERAEPHRYLGLVEPSVRSRINFVTAPGSDGPRDGTLVDMLYVDSSHERQQTIAEVRAWAPVLAPGALIVFDDYQHPGYPGVAEAIAELRLDGQRRGGLFVHRGPAGVHPESTP